MSHAPGGPDPAASALQRARGVLREQGARGLVFGVLAQTVYRRLVIIERETEPGPPDNPLGLEGRFLGPSELDAYEALRPGERPTAERRFAAGARCFGARLDGRLVSVRWLETGAPWIEYLDMSIRLAADEIYHHDSFVDPALRNRGIATSVQRLVSPLLAAEGRRTQVAVILPENRPAWHQAPKAGYRIAGRMGYVRLGPWRHEFLRREPSAGERAARLLREEGFRSVLFGALAETVYRRLVIAEREIGPAPTTDPLGLDSRFLEAADLDAYEALRPGGRAAAAARLAAGTRCFGSWLDGRLVSVRWLAAGAPRIDYLGLPIGLAEGEVYHHDSYVDPALRGRGIATRSQLQLVPVLAAEGVRRSVRAILPENRAALREAAKAGYRITGRIGYVRLGPWKRGFERRRPL